MIEEGGLKTPGCFLGNIRGIPGTAICHLDGNNKADHGKLEDLHILIDCGTAGDTPGETGRSLFPLLLP